MQYRHGRGSHSSERSLGSKDTTILEMVTQESEKPASIRKRLIGWRIGILIGAVVALVVLLINISALAYASTRKDLPIDNAISTGYFGAGPANAGGRKTLYGGDCETVRKLNVGIHLLINVLSTVLLGACNYAMQCLSAPTRADLDKAHSRRQWVDIGVFSIRNISKVGVYRSCLWALLALSSFPLHLFYNSVVYSSTYTKDYVVFSTTEAMLRSNSLATPLETHTYYNGTNITSSSHFATEAASLLAKNTAKLLDRLDNKACINAYSTLFPIMRSSLILVTAGNSSDIAPPYDYVNAHATINGYTRTCLVSPYQWICGDTSEGNCSPEQRTCAERLSLIDPSNWRPFGQKVEYCLSDKFEQQCELLLVPKVAAVVIAFNAVKIFALLYVFFALRDRPLTTLGEAVASFMSHPDKTTKGICPMDIRNLDGWRRHTNSAKIAPRPYARERRRWSSIASSGRWFACLFLYAAAILLCIVLLCVGLFGHPRSAKQLLKIGLGASDPQTYIYGWLVPSYGTSGVIYNAFVANSPQVILSGIYMTYNGLFTYFMLGREWDRFALEQRGLRVNGTARGAQRPTTFLQLPLYCSIPLLIVSGVLHWLCSQSIFLVSLRINEAIICVIVVGVFKVLALLLVGRRRYHGILPMAGSCSAAISAMCHPGKTEERKDLAALPLKWGVTGCKDGIAHDAAVGHCSFSNQEVERPVEGQLYAG